MIKNLPCSAGDPGSIPWSGRPTGERIGYPLQYSWTSLVFQLVKNLPQYGRPGFDPWVGKILWRKERLPTPVLWPGDFHGLCGPWGHKELDTTERLSLSLSCNAGDACLIPDQGTKIPHAAVTEPKHSRTHGPQLKSLC